MKAFFTLLLIALYLIVVFNSCRQDCDRVAQPALYFTLVDQANKPVLTNGDRRDVAIVYRYGGRYNSNDTLRLSGTLGPGNTKYPSSSVLVSAAILERSVIADSASYQLLLDKKPVGTLRLYPFQKSTECYNWTYTSGVTFNGKFVPPVGPTNEVYLLPVTP